MQLLEGPVGPVRALAFSADGLTLAAVSGRSHVIWLWDLETGKPRTQLRGHERRVVSLAFSPTKAERLASADSRGRVLLWELDQSERYDEEVQVSPEGHSECEVKFAPDGERLACNRARPRIEPDERGWNHVTVWRVGTGDELDLPTGHRGEVSCVAFTHDGASLATGSFDRTVRLHDSRAARKLPYHGYGLLRPDFDNVPSLQHGPKVRHLACSPDGNTLASASSNGLIKLWDAATWHKRTTLKGQAKPLHAIAFSPDGTTLASAAGDGTVRVWDLLTALSREAFDWGIGPVSAVAFAPDGMRAAAGGEGRIVLWDVDWGA
jgi:WD40 repeat protein